MVSLINILSIHTLSNKLVEDACVNIPMVTWRYVHTRTIYQYTFGDRQKPLHVTRPAFHHFYLKMDPAQNGEGAKFTTLQ